MESFWRWGAASLRIVALSVVLSVGLLISDEAYGRLEEQHPRNLVSQVRLPVVDWAGNVSCQEDRSDTCEMRFTLENGDSYDVESPALREVLKKEKRTLKVQLRAKKTPKFLFWGNVLIVQQFKVIN